jgi:bifunctional DNA-binding transcriptional regulator/antitoxin component of YhaV-PrlF toxin-antitoxin module
MKSVTKIDSRGRIALSPKLRNILKVEIGDYVQIDVVEDKLIISKFTG